MVAGEWNTAREGKEVMQMASRITRTEKKWLPCLKCGKLILTDKYRRFCKKCRNANMREVVGREPVRVASDGPGELDFLEADW